MIFGALTVQDLIPHDPTAPPLSPTENSPPPFLPPPVPEDAIKPDKLTEAQRILRTKEVPVSRGRDTLLEMIRSSSFNLKPVEFKQVREIAAVLLKLVMNVTPLQICKLLDLLYFFLEISLCVNCFET